MNVVTVIPARGGSKSLPKKNIHPLNGKPLIQYSIEYSLQCPLILHTVVSTDCQEIADIAKRTGAEVPFLRPLQYAQDDTRDYPVMRLALETLEKHYDQHIDAIALLRPTSPLRPPGLIEKAIHLLQKDPLATSVRTVTKCEQHPFRMWQMQDHYMIGYEKEIYEPFNIPRQELPTLLFQTGDLEMVTRETLLAGSVSGTRVLPIIMHPDEMMDIDHQKDLTSAEQRLQK
ncbi:MAG: cytidylyltransferase domain-containing protein [Candidatus Latescibacterota bacterium]